MFSFFKKKRLLSVAEDMGYDCAWLGLDNSNPHVPHTPHWRAYEWGYQSGLDDIKEWEEANTPAFDFETGDWPYLVIQ